MGLKARFRLLLTGTPVQNNVEEVSPHGRRCACISSPYFFMQLVSLLRFVVTDMFQACKLSSSSGTGGSSGGRTTRSGDAATLCYSLKAITLLLQLQMQRPLPPRLQLHLPVPARFPSQRGPVPTTLRTAMAMPRRMVRFCDPFVDNI